MTTLNERRKLEREKLKYANKIILPELIDSIESTLVNPNESVSIIIPVKNALPYLRKCLDSIKRNTKNYELILIDNDCNKRTKDYMIKVNHPELKIIINEKNMGVPYSWNQGIKLAKYNFFCFLNSDTIVTLGWLDKLLNCFEVKPDCGICGPSTSQCGSAQAQKVMEEIRFKVTVKQIEEFAQSLPDKIILFARLIGFCFVVKREVFNTVGVFDYRRFKLGCTEEREFTWRANKLGKYNPYWVQNSYVHHYGDITFKNLGMDVNTYNKPERQKWEITKNKVIPKFIENDVEIREVKIGRKSYK